MEGPAGVLRQVDHRLPAVQPLVRERRDGAPVHGIAGGADHRGGDPGARHGPHGREGPPARGRGAEKRGSRSVGVSRGGRNMVERVFNRMKHHRKAATRYDRLDETFLANLQLILIAIYLKKTQPKTQLVQTHANTNTSTPALRQSSGYDWQI